MLGSGPIHLGRLGLSSELELKSLGSGLNYLGWTYIRFRTNIPVGDLV